MGFSTVAKNEALDGILVDRIRLHSGDPGGAGTDNALGGGLSAATFDAASSGERPLNADVTVTGLTPAQSVTHFSVWLNSGTVFKGGFPITAGAVNADGSGQYVLKAPDTKLTASDS